MEITNLNQLAGATLEMAQGALLPLLGVCLIISILFLFLQISFSFNDFSLQFLLKLILVVGIGAFMAKSFGERYVVYSRSVFKSAAGMVR